MQQLHVDRLKLEALCREYHVKRLAIFGSSLREEDTPGSDLDLLVEFEPGKIPGFGYFHLQDELSYLFGKTVDLNTAGFISPYFREEIVKTASNVYVQQ